MQNAFTPRGQNYESSCGVSYNMNIVFLHTITICVSKLTCAVYNRRSLYFLLYWSERWVGGGAFFCSYWLIQYYLDFILLVLYLYLSSGPYSLYVLRW